MDNELRIAILIDADNVSDKYIKIIVDEVANIGIATYKRIYGDWTSARLSSWKNVLLEDSIIPIQQYSYTTGKNATDSAMIIDAMDILYLGGKFAQQTVVNPTAFQKCHHFIAQMQLP